MAQWRRREDVHNGAVRLAVFESPLPGTSPSGDDPRPTVVLVHGWPDTHHLWTHVAPLLAGDFRVIAYDCRGFGDSDRPDGDDPYRLSEMADDLFAVIDAVSPDNAVHVLAHDWGSVSPGRPSDGATPTSASRRSCRCRVPASINSARGRGRGYVGRRPQSGPGDGTDRVVGLHRVFPSTGRARTVLQSYRVADYLAGVSAPGGGHAAAECGVQADAA